EIAVEPEVAVEAPAEVAPSESYALPDLEEAPAIEQPSAPLREQLREQAREMPQTHSMGASAGGTSAPSRPRPRPITPGAPRPRPVASSSGFMPPRPVASATPGGGGAGTARRDDRKPGPGGPGGGGAGTGAER